MHKVLVISSSSSIITTSIGLITPAAAKSVSPKVSLQI